MYMLLSALFGVLGATGGILASYFFHIAVGPAFVILLGILFFLSVIGPLRRS